MVKIDTNIDQIEIEEWFVKRHGNESWTTLFQSKQLAKTGITLYACLLPTTKISQALKVNEWSLLIGSGGPGFVQEYKSGKEVTLYRHSLSHGEAEPIIHKRHFSNHRKGYVEVAEQIKLLFNLYEDRASGIFYEMQEDGNDIDVIRITDNTATIRTSLLKRYCAARQMALELDIESDVWLNPEDEGYISRPIKERTKSTDTYRLEYYGGLLPIGENSVFSRIIGKKIILPPNPSESGIWPYEYDKQYTDFKIKHNGQEITHTSDPAQLANYFGKNEGSPHYLTPVFFKSEVLRKYYADEVMYSVEDGGIRCGGVWYLRLDNDHPDYVMVYLGDLGRDLPHSEQQYWKLFNISPDGRTMSNTAWRRGFMAEFANPQSPEHRFKQSYASLNKTWEAVFGWKLYKELHGGDLHVLSSLHIPLSSNQQEFDEQVLDLAKLIIDYLNEHEIVNQIGKGPKGEKGLGKLRRLLDEINYNFVERDLALLQTIQGLRSRGSAHKKGEDYNIGKAGLNPDDLRTSFIMLLDQAAAMIDDLENYVRNLNKQHSIDKSS